MSFTMSHRAARWKLRTRELAFGPLPLLMGIINVTPDSFSDGGHCFDAEAAVAHGLRLAAAGADILDVGGESTRPYAQPVDVQEELRRVMPVVGALCQQTDLPISIDTQKAMVARHAIHAGAEILNDITALRGDPDMLPLAIETGVGLCIMHMQGTPQTMQADPAYDDVVAEVFAFLRDRREALTAAGIDPQRIAVDPGIGFGKTARHNLQLLANASKLHELGCPVLVGHSRKRFIAETLAADVHASSAGHAMPAERTSGTIGVALSLARQGVQILRVHDVAEVRQALRMFEASGGMA